LKGENFFETQCSILAVYRHTQREYRQRRQRSTSCLRSSKSLMTHKPMNIHRSLDDSKNVIAQMSITNMNVAHISQLTVTFQIIFQVQIPNFIFTSGKQQKPQTIRKCYKKVCYRWLHSAPRVKRETRIQFCWGSVPLGPNFTGTWSSHATIW